MNIEDISNWYGITFDGELIFADSISDWSWAAILIVFWEAGKYYINDDYDTWSPYSISEEEAMVQIEDFLHE